MKNKRNDRRRALVGKRVENNARYFAKDPAARRLAIVKWNNGGRKRAHDRARKYGLTLRQIESVGLDLYPDILEALNGNR